MTIVLHLHLGTFFDKVSGRATWTTQINLRSLTVVVSDSWCPTPVAAIICTKSLVKFSRYDIWRKNFVICSRISGFFSHCWQAGFTYHLCKADLYYKRLYVMVNRCYGCAKLYILVIADFACIISPEHRARIMHTFSVMYSCPVSYLSGNWRSLFPLKLRYYYALKNDYVAIKNL